MPKSFADKKNEKGELPERLDHNADPIKLLKEGERLYSDGRLDEAMLAFEEVEKVCRKTGDKRNLSEALNYQGSVLEDLEQYEEALKLHSHHSPTAPSHLLSCAAIAVCQREGFMALTSVQDLNKPSKWRGPYLVAL